MNKYPTSLEDVIESFCLLPGVGRKSAERFAMYMLFSVPEEKIIDFSNSLLSIKKDIHICPLCGNITEKEICNICEDKDRNHKMVLVVENVRDLLVIENTHSYHGIYHVLNGAISFSKGVTIDDLNINSLLEKVKNNELDEIILATSTTLEGETTSRYLKELLSPYNVNITRIAQGLSIGSDLAYQDEMTLIKAFEGRGKY